MSTTYRSGQVPSNVGELLTFLRLELVRLEQALNAAQPYGELQVLHVEPERLRPGMLVIADGADWDPGSGAGLYRRNAANSAWVLVG